MKCNCLSAQGPEPVECLRHCEPDLDDTQEIPVVSDDYQYPPEVGR